jgi:hypothetical protein
LHQPSAESKVCLEKLIVSQLVKKYPAFCRTPRFITVYKIAHHLPLFIARLFHFISDILHLFNCYLNIIFQFMLRFSSSSLSFRFSHQNPVGISVLPHTSHKFFLSYPLWYNETYKLRSCSSYNLFQSPASSSRSSDSPLALLTQIIQTHLRVYHKDIRISQAFV